MLNQNQYEVMKFTEHGTRCYISADYVSGQSLIQYLKYHPNIEKHQLFEWMRTIIRQLGLYHRSKKHTYYRYVNPYSIIITEDKQVYFLDLKAESNQDILHGMQRRTIRSHFMPPGRSCNSKGNFHEDCYSLGKLLQFMLSRSDMNPPLTKREEYKFLKIIQKCLETNSNKQYQEIRQIIKYFPSVKAKETKQSKRTIIAITAGVFILLLAVMIQSLGRNLQAQELKSKPKTAKEPGKQAAIPHQDYFELGLAYFIELKDYKKSVDSFKKCGMQDESADCFVKLAQYMQDNRQPTGGIEQTLEKTERLIRQKNKIPYYYALVRVYATLRTEKARESLIRIGEICLKDTTWQAEDDEHVMEIELRNYMAAAYEQEEAGEEAIKQYEALRALEPQKEDYIIKLLKLYQLQDKLEQAFAICKDGMNQFPSSEELRIQYIEMQCRDSNIERDICAETIRGCLDEMPKLVENKEFQKLQKQYQITMEGEQVWVGR